MNPFADLTQQEHDAAIRAGLVHAYADILTSDGSIDRARLDALLIVLIAKAGRWQAFMESALPEMGRIPDLGPDLVEMFTEMEATLNARLLAFGR